MPDDRKDFEEKLRKTLKPDEGSSKERKASSREAMDEMLEQSGLSKNVARSEKATREPVEMYMATHTVKSGDSLSALAQQYYGSASRDDWMAIYEANKDIIGDNPSLIKPGQELKIPKR